MYIGSIAGIEVYHMLQQHGADLQLYKKKISEVSTILGKIASTSQIIWLNQYPTVDFYSEISESSSAIHTDKIHHYNGAVKLILK
jgi:hypothetical protein